MSQRGLVWLGVFLVCTVFWFFVFLTLYTVIC